MSPVETSYRQVQYSVRVERSDTRCTISQGESTGTFTHDSIVASTLDARIDGTERNENAIQSQRIRLYEHAHYCSHDHSKS